jgi:uncharacterized protein YyaL (SSP411 family)
LKHSFCEGRLAHPATADDYAALVRAALALFEATAEAGFLAQAEAWLAVLDRHYKDEGGGYFLSADDVTDVILRHKHAHDHATPSGNGMLVHAFARLYYLTGKADYRARAERLIAAFSGELERNALAMPVLLAGRLLLENAVQVVVVGAPGDAEADALQRAAFAAAEPNLVFERLADTAALPSGHPAQGKTAPAGRSGAPGAAAYVCRGPVCSLPLTDPAALAEALAKPPA